MKKWQVLFLISFLLALPLRAQFYRAGEDTSSVSNSRFWVEMSAAVTRAFYQLEDGGGNKQFSHQDGFSGRVLFLATPWLGIGAEGTWLKEEKQIPWVNSYKVKRYGLVGKFTLTPDTAPKAYLLVGAGKTKYRLSYDFDSFEQDASLSYFLAGAGVDVTIWRGLFLAAELTATYNKHRETGDFFWLKHHCEIGASLRAGLRF